MPTRDTILSRRCPAERTQLPPSHPDRDLLGYCIKCINLRFIAAICKAGRILWNRPRLGDPKNNAFLRRSMPSPSPLPALFAEAFQAKRREKERQADTGVGLFNLEGRSASPVVCRTIVNADLYAHSFPTMNAWPPTPLSVPRTRTKVRAIRGHVPPCESQARLVC